MIRTYFDVSFVDRQERNTTSTYTTTTTTITNQTTNNNMPDETLLKYLVDQILYIESWCPTIIGNSPLFIVLPQIHCPPLCLSPTWSSGPSISSFLTKKMYSKRGQKIKRGIFVKPNTMKKVIVFVKHYEKNNSVCQTL